VAEPSDRTPKEAAAQGPAGIPGDGQSGPGPQQIQIQVDDSRALTAYANFFRVAGMPEELILDFGLNTQPVGVPNQPIPITLRVILNFYTAKRILHALRLAIQRYETTFGVLETDIQKRVKPGPRG
jgi:hypothetical protein